MDVDQKSLRREVLRLALPSVGEQLIRFSSNIVDTVLVGHLGAVSLAILGLSNQLFLLGTVWITPVMVGSGILVAQSVGGGDRDRANRVLGQAIWLSIGLGLCLLGLGWQFAPDLLSLIGAEPQIIGRGIPFLRLLFVNFPIFFLVFVVNSCLRGAGDTRTPMYLIVIETVVRISSAVVLVNGLFGAPKLGAPGVAVGAIFGQVSGLVVLIYWLARGRLVLDLRLVRLKLDVNIGRAILRLGIPSGGEQLALRLGQTVNVYVLAGLGTVGYAAYLVGFNALSVPLTAGIGFTIAATTIVGQRVGAGRPTEARNGALQTWLLAMFTMTSIGVTLALGAKVILSLFTTDQSVVALATLPLQLVAIVLPAEATNQILSGAFRGSGDTLWPFYVTTAGNWLMRLPITLILIGHFGLLGAWFAVMFEISVRALLNAWKFFRTDWLRTSSPVTVGVEQ